MLSHSFPAKNEQFDLLDSFDKLLNSKKLHLYSKLIFLSENLKLRMKKIRPGLLTVYKLCEQFLKYKIFCIGPVFTVFFLYDHGWFKTLFCLSQSWDDTVLHSERRLSSMNITGMRCQLWTRDLPCLERYQWLISHHKKLENSLIQGFTAFIYIAVNMYHHDPWVGGVASTSPVHPYKEWVGCGSPYYEY